MDVADLDAVSVVLGAIAASAGAGWGDAVKDMTKSSILAARDRLIALVRERFKGDSLAEARLTVYAADPSPANSQALEGHLAAADIDQDQEILTLAREVLNAAGPAALAPGSVAANVINQVNSDGATGYIGGQHVHNHGVPAAAAHVGWDLFRLEGDGYELRNTGTATATDVTLVANVELAWPTPQDRDITPGSSVMFICSPSLADPSPILTVTCTVGSTDGRQRWQRPLPR